MGRWFRRRASAEIPTDMFDVAKIGEQARQAHKLASIYHKGQDLAWDGREVLAELIEKHGGITIPDDKRQALSRIYAIILWGELAAWRISAQLADSLIDLEAKMAATAQAHDEARHFYVMHDYLEQLGEVPTTLEKPTRIVLDMVLGTPSLLQKLSGMQLMVETFALTIFQVTRRANVEPVLSELLRFFERDEARHVGLGVQYMPTLMKESSRLELLQSFVFQMRILGWTLKGLKNHERDFETLGIPVRDVIDVARNKLFTATEMMWNEMAENRPWARKQAEAILDATVEVIFPQPELAHSLLERLRTARKVYAAGGVEADQVELAGA
ncbi:MAG: ferritin-like domain-containing protein [Deltaproteobacteria bacterium]|nr:ferritin-like domain-containing protein [Deltaproteobacteria bacterium]